MFCSFDDKLNFNVEGQNDDEANSTKVWRIEK